MPRRLRPARSASSPCDSPAAVRCRRSSAPNEVKPGENSEHTSVGGPLMAVQHDPRQPRFYGPQRRPGVIQTGGPTISGSSRYGWRAWPELGSIISDVASTTSKLPPPIRCKAARSLSFQRLSGAPLTYQLLPLSASSMP